MDAVAEENATLSPQPGRNAGFTRTYIACERCRRRKVKCVINLKPPCVKCSREHRTCVFPQYRNSRKQREPPNWADLSDGQQQDDNVVPRSAQSSGRRLAADRSEQSSFPSPLASHGDAARIRAHESLVERAVPSPMLSSGGTPLFSSEARTEPESTRFGTSLLSRSAGVLHSPQATNDRPSLAAPTEINDFCEASPELLAIWSKCRFVRQGWLTAQAAISYVKLFWQHISPLTLVRVSDYCIPANHERLIQREPMMCCTILMISSRCFTLPGTRGLLRAQMLHQRLWEYGEVLIRRILYGLEKTSTSRIRVVSTIESFLLISDWHPRAILFPLDHEAYDSDPEPLDTRGIREAERSSGPSVEWRDSVLEPARRSDRMSLMMLGVATNLAYELGLFGDDLGMMTDDAYERQRRMRTRKLLYICVTNIAVRMGFPSGLPQDIVFASSKESFNALNERGTPFEAWNNIADLWLELVRLSKTASAIFFGSRTHTQKQLLNGQYVTLIHHFVPMLDRWNEKLQAALVPEFKALCDLLIIEYHTLRSFIYALSMQAVVERASARQLETYSQHELKDSCFLAQDISFLHEVIVSSQEILRLATSMALSGVLRLMPVRQTLSVISTSILLFKAISLGACDSDLHSSLEILECCIFALNSATANDEFDFSARFAALIEARIAVFKATFSSAPNNGGMLMGLHPVRGDPLEGIPGVATTPVGLGVGQASSSRVGDSEFGDNSNWWTRPFEPSFAPFSAWDDHISANLEIDSLDFLWNADTESDPIGQV